MIKNEIQNFSYFFQFNNLCNFFLEIREFFKNLILIKNRVETIRTHIKEEGEDLKRLLS